MEICWDRAITSVISPLTTKQTTNKNMRTRMPSTMFPRKLLAAHMTNACRPCSPSTEVRTLCERDPSRDGTHRAEDPCRILPVQHTAKKVGMPHSNIHDVYTYVYIYTVHVYFLIMYVHAYIRTYIHTCIHTYVRTYVHTYIRTYIHTYVHT